MMQVATYYSNEDIRLEEVPRPKIGPGELLIRVWACGICGTDVLQWYRRDKTPLVLGHEIAGEIAEVGEGLKQYHKGQRVCASHHVPCGRCSYCLRGHQTVCETLRKTHFDPGGFVEFLRLPQANVELGGVYALPDNLSYEEATFIEPLACVLRGQKAAGLLKDRSVLILGCGISGLLHVMLAKLGGASFIAAADIVDYRLQQARRFGADAVLNARREDLPGRIRQLNQNQAADLVIVATGAKTANLAALQSVQRGGTILFFAATDEGVEIPLSVNELFWRNEVTLTSSYAATPQEHLQALSLLSTRKIPVSQMITHRFGLDRIQEGFRLVAEAGESLKVIIEPQK
jgi:L-iditol 2-dehydrogenase